MRTLLELDERNFRHEVLNSPQPVLVNFWSDCDECSRQFVSTVETVAVEFTGRVKVARVNAVKNAGLANLCFVKTLPTLIYFADGIVRDRIVGEEQPEAIAYRLESLLLNPWCN